MTHYAINHEHVASTQATGIAAAVARFVRNWKARRAVARLQDFDDYMLRDIGVTRLDVRWAADLPLTINAALALEERSHRRRHGRLRD
jgi:uncharacterized protein YjiS (DUF1127 family)